MAFQDVEIDDIERSLHDWLGSDSGFDSDGGFVSDDWFGDMDWDDIQRELDEFEAAMQAWSDLEIARPVDVDTEDTILPGTGVLHLDGRRWTFDIAACVLPSPAAQEINVVGTAIVEGTGKAFEITLTQIPSGFGTNDLMSAVTVETDDDMLMVTAFSPADDVSLALAGDGIIRGEGTITSFTTFQKYHFVVTAYCQ